MTPARPPATAATGDGVRLTARRAGRRVPVVSRPRMKVNLRCTCGGTLKGSVSPSTALVKIRDVYLSFHRGDEHDVTDSSEDAL